MPVRFRHLALTVLPFVVSQIFGATPDLLIVGAGISGLSAAAEGARLGLRVTVIDRQSLYGGIAVNAYGVTVTGSPLQEQLGLKDSEELAAHDFVDWGGDPDPFWVKYYLKHSKAELFDWFAERGVRYESVAKTRGSSVARFHFPRGGVVAMVQALYREIHLLGGVEFVMNSDVTSLVFEQARVIGVQVRDYRSGSSRTIVSRNVLLATGGFQSNEDFVRKFWPAKLGKPKRVLLGAGLEATGAGLDLARSAGARIEHMDRQWNYVPGIPLPDDFIAGRGVYVDFSGPIWVNAQGKRFVNETADRSIRLDAITRQDRATAWMIFDSALRPAIELVHPVFNVEPNKSNLLGRPDVLHEAASIEKLAQMSGLPAKALVETVARYNDGFISGRDEFGRQIPSTVSSRSTTRPIKEAPFFALPVYPITRKSMGGIQVDTACRVISESGMAVPGLYASGEAAGQGGVNGKQSLEGTFVGAAILMGRVAARSIADSAETTTRRVAGETPSFPVPLTLGTPSPALDAACLVCHKLPSLTAVSRPGYRHFELSHRIVLERNRSCHECHAGLTPYLPETHRIDKLAQASTCNACHSSPARR